MTIIGFKVWHHYLITSSKELNIIDCRRIPNSTAQKTTEKKERKIKKKNIAGCEAKVDNM